MDNNSKQRFLACTLPELAGCFGLAAESLAVIQDHRNFVYRAATAGG